MLSSLCAYVAMEDVEWPSQPVPEAVKKLLRRFYRLIDSTDPFASEKLAERVFTEDGQLLVNKRFMSGRQRIGPSMRLRRMRVLTQHVEIRNWHKGTDDNVVSREHKVHRVYVCNVEADDILMTGTLRMESNLGLTGSTSYCARCVVQDADSTYPRVRLWQFWLVRLLARIAVLSSNERQDPAPFFDLGIMRPPMRKMSASGILDTIGGR